MAHFYGHGNHKKVRSSRYPVKYKTLSLSHASSSSSWSQSGKLACQTPLECWSLIFQYFFDQSKEKAAAAALRSNIWVNIRLETQGDSNKSHASNKILTLQDLRSWINSNHHVAFCSKRVKYGMKKQFHSPRCGLRRSSCAKSNANKNMSHITTAEKSQGKIDLYNKVAEKRITTRYLSNDCVQLWLEPELHWMGKRPFLYLTLKSLWPWPL